MSLEPVYIYHAYSHFFSSNTVNVYVLPCHFNNMIPIIKYDEEQNFDKLNVCILKIIYCVVYRLKKCCEQKVKYLAYCVGARGR